MATTALAAHAATATATATAVVAVSVFNNVRVRVLHPDLNAGARGDGDVLAADERAGAADAVLRATPRTADLSCELVAVVGNGVEVLRAIVTPASERCRISPVGFVVAAPNGARLLVFRSADDGDSFANLLRASTTVDLASKRPAASEFECRTDITSSTQYFHYYGMLFQQQNMLQDYMRTGTYQRAILENAQDFFGRTVLDVGAGSGELRRLATDRWAAHRATTRFARQASCRSLLCRPGRRACMQSRPAPWRCICVGWPRATALPIA
jgi:hypothetical protein